MQILCQSDEVSLAKIAKDSIQFKLSNKKVKRCKNEECGFKAVRYFNRRKDGYYEPYCKECLSKRAKERRKGLIITDEVRVKWRESKQAFRQKNPLQNRTACRRYYYKKKRERFAKLVYKLSNVNPNLI